MTPRLLLSWVVVASATAVVSRLLGDSSWPRKLLSEKSHRSELSHWLSSSFRILEGLEGVDEVGTASGLRSPEKLVLSRRPFVDERPNSDESDISRRLEILGGEETRVSIISGITGKTS